MNKQTNCWLVFTHRSHLKYYLFFLFINRIFPALTLALLGVILSGVWYRKHKAGYTSDQNDKFQNIAFLASASLLILMNLCRSLNTDSTDSINLSGWWQLVQPSIVILWLSLVPELRKALGCCVCIMNESETTMLLDD